MTDHTLSHSHLNPEHLSLSFIGMHYKSSEFHALQLTHITITSLLPAPTQWVYYILACWTRAPSSVSSWVLQLHLTLWWTFCSALNSSNWLAKGLYNRVVCELLPLWWQLLPSCLPDIPPHIIIAIFLILITSIMLIKT